MGVRVFTYDAYEISGGQALARNTRMGGYGRGVLAQAGLARVLSKMSLKVVSLCFLRE